MNYLKFSFFLFFLSVNCSKAQKITFENKIGPLIFKHCSVCHQSGEVAPFTLVNYEDVYKHSKMILNVIQKKYMPPWPADPNYSHLAEENYLSDEEISMVKTWINTGLPEGEKIVYTPSYNNGVKLNEKLLGKPDLILKYPSPIFLKGNNKESFWIVKIPFELEQDTSAIAIQFIPDNKKFIHHVSSYLLSFKFDNSFNVKKEKNIYNMETDMVNPGSAAELNVQNSDGSLPKRVLGPGWIPGANLILWPKDIGGYRLSKQGMLIVNIHYTSTPTDEVDNSEIWMYFSKTKPKRMVFNEMMGTAGGFPVIPPLFLPADSISHFTVKASIPRDISLLSFNPHMHNLGKTIKSYAITPKGDTIKLIRINNWNVDYQYTYRLNKILKLEKGSVLYVEATYDNTANNPKNPFNPPRNIVGLPDGSIMRSTDEMLNFDIRYLFYQPGDENIPLE